MEKPSTCSMRTVHTHGPWVCQQLGFTPEGQPTDYCVDLGCINISLRRHRVYHYSVIPWISTCGTLFIWLIRALRLVIEVLSEHSNQEDILGFSGIFRPCDGVDDWDYEKIIVDDLSYHEGHGKLYETLNIEPEKGCLVVLWPTSYIRPLEEYDVVDRFFSGFMIARIVQYVCFVVLVVDTNNVHPLAGDFAGRIGLESLDTEYLDRNP